MKRTALLTIGTLSTMVLASSAAMAYQAGDVYVRGGYAKSDIKTHNVSDEGGATLAGGYLFHDKFGIELSTSEEIEHDFGLAGKELGSVDRLPVNLLVNYYPLGGLDSRVQPYMGLGVNYTHFSNVDTSAGDIDIDSDYGVMGQLGVDLMVNDYLSVSGFAQYADIDAEAERNGNDLGTVKLNPVTIGGGITYRF
ncbi:OmpW/AlkL family protein [Halomonas organivorans]|uniref:Outer membrane protein n=1 Tax=Halomonas organivorans TaxID=257772 RepID=A0A7W5BX98_9GAMM|nr:OmpW family outer membrane protein [Halomonas organivorans]MBB3140774.1 outer membrane protein [Halomonas organivorans]